MAEILESPRAVSRPASCPLSQHLPLVVVSPHLDDAVFSCGSVLSRCPGSTVVTVYTGLPDNPGMLTKWDRACGFADAAAAMRERVEENRHALAAIGCKGRSLGLLDCQYLECPDVAMPRLTECLLATLHDLAHGAVAIPLGVFHGDHLRVSDAALLIREASPDVPWFLYEDAPHRAQPGVVQQRLVQLQARGLMLTPAGFAGDVGDKADAIAAYASQLRGFNGMPADLFQPERYWRLGDKGDYA